MDSMDSVKVVGYTRLSKDEKARGGVGLQTQRAAVEAECERHGWQLVRVEQDDGVSGTVDPDKRPGLARALAAVEGGDANVLVVSRLDRLTRSLLGFGSLVERAQRQRWRLVVVEQQFDLGTGSGRAMAGMLAVFAQFERDLISERTKEAMAQVKLRTPAERAALGKKPIGRPVTLDARVRRRILGLRSRGHSYHEIARRLDADKVPTAHGGQRWHAMTVRGIADDYDKDAEPKRRKPAA